MAKKTALQKLQLPLGIGSGRKELFDSPRLTLSLGFNAETKEIEGQVTFGVLSQGPPNHAHGGLSSFVLDEAMGSLGWQLGFPVVAQKLEIEFLNMAPIDKPLPIVARLKEKKKSSIVVEAEIGEGESAFCKGLGVFHVLSLAQLKKLAESLQRPPEEFLKYLEEVSLRDQRKNN